MTTVAEQELDELQQRYFDLMVTAAHTGDTTEVEKMNVRMKALESRVKLHRALTDPELEELINEVENEWRDTQEDAAVYSEAERNFLMRQMQSDAEHISTTGRGISPVDEGHPTYDYEFDMRRIIKENLTTGNTGPRVLSSTKVDPDSGVRTRTTYDGDIVSHPTNVRTYTDNQGVSLRSEYQPPDADLLFGDEQGPAIELQRLESRDSGPWRSVQDKGYKWLKPSEAEIQEQLGVLDKVHGRERGSDDYQRLEEKMQTVDDEEQGIFRDDELVRSEVELGSLEEPLLGDREADYLKRLDRMQAQDTEAVRMKTRLRQLEARKLALRQRMLEAKPLAEFGGPELGSFGSDANRVALAMEIQEANVLTSGEIMLRFGKTVGENAAAMAAFTALGFALPEKASRDLNIVMDGAAVAALISGVDPVFAAVQGTVELWKELNAQGKRQKYDIESDRDHGKNFGYVRDGAHWYPAFVQQHEKWHGGFGERGNDLDLVYGDHMYMKVLPNGKIEPHFAHPIGIRHVSGSDKDLEKSFAHMSKEDGIQDWYLLQPDELDTVKREGQLLVVPKGGFVVHKDDWSVYNVPPRNEEGEPYLPAWWKSNLDLRRSLDYIKHWQIGSNTLDPGRSQHDSHIDPSLALDASNAMISRLDTDFKQAWPGDENYVLKDHWSGTKEHDTNNVLLKQILGKQIVELQKAQFMAAKEQGYAEETFHSVKQTRPDYLPGMLITMKKQPDYLEPTSQPWRNYVDFQKDLPVAIDSASLQKQLYAINHYTDRTFKQRAYLGQKAVVRYLMNTVNDRGGADDMVEYLTRGRKDEHGRLNRVGDNEYTAEGFFGLDRMQKYVPPWANAKEGAVPAPMVHSLDEENRDLTDHLSQVAKESLEHDESSWAHSTGSRTKPPEWHVKIHGVEHALQTSQDPPKAPKQDAPKKARFDDTTKLPYRTVKDRSDVSLQELYSEFKANGVRNLSKNQIRRVRNFEAKKAAAQAQQFQNADPRDKSDKWFVDQGNRYRFDTTLKPPRWVSSLDAKQQTKRMKSLQKIRKEHPLSAKAERLQQAQAEVKRKKYTEALFKGDQKDKVRVAKAIAKGAPAKEQVAQVTKHKRVKFADSPGFEDYDHRDRRDPKDPWYGALSGTFWNGKRWVDHPVTHLHKLLGAKQPDAQAQTVPVVHKASVVAKAHGDVPVIDKPKPKEVVRPPEHMHHVAPSDLAYAGKHPGYVPVARLSWNENAVAKFEGRPITSHASVEQPSHEAPIPPTHVKVI